MISRWHNMGILGKEEFWAGAQPNPSQPMHSESSQTEIAGDNPCYQRLSTKSVTRAPSLIFGIGVDKCDVAALPNIDVPLPDSSLSHFSSLELFCPDPQGICMPILQDCAFNSNSNVPDCLPRRVNCVVRPTGQTGARLERHSLDRRPTQKTNTKEMDNIAARRPACAAPGS
jgi:hypothetical protein